MEHRGGRQEGREIPVILVGRLADDHHAFHEDAKPVDLSLQFGMRFNLKAMLCRR